MSRSAFHRGFSTDKQNRMRRWEEMRLPFFRAVMNMQHKDAAALIGVSRRAYNHYVSGEAVPTHETMDKIEEYLNA